MTGTGKSYARSFSPIRKPKATTAKSNCSTAVWASVGPAISRPNTT